MIFARRATAAIMANKRAKPRLACYVCDRSKPRALVKVSGPPGERRTAGWEIDCSECRERHRVRLIADWRPATSMSDLAGARLDVEGVERTMESQAKTRVSTRDRITEALRDNGGEMTTEELAEAIGRAPNTVTQSLVEMGRRIAPGKTSYRDADGNTRERTTYRLADDA
jgi:hypothetical protein